MSPPARLRRFAPDKALSSHGQIAKVLGAEILGGIHPPGTNLPPESELLSRFQVSRPVLREVLKTLSAKGLVLAKTRVGTKVLDPVNWNLFDAEVLSWKLSAGMDEDFQRHLEEIRLALEPRAAALAAERRTAEDLAQLKRCIALMRCPGHDARSFAEADLDFHLAIGDASGNPMMRSMAGVIEAVLLASFSLSSPVKKRELHESTVEAHERIVEAIAARDAKRAQGAMVKVIEVGFERIRSEQTIARRKEKRRA
jgi:DNA-binding FadR family transcriptional regulator